MFPGRAAKRYESGVVWPYNLGHRRRARGSLMLVNEIRSRRNRKLTTRIRPGDDNAIPFGNPYDRAIKMNESFGAFARVSNGNHELLADQRTGVCMQHGVGPAAICTLLNRFHKMIWARMHAKVYA